MVSRNVLPLPLPLPPEMWPSVEHLVTEDDTPVDNLYSEKQQKLLTEALYASWAGPGDDRPYVAVANVGVFYSHLQPPVVPDMLLSLDVHEAEDLWPKQNRCYFIWVFGKPPDLVVEVVSNRKGGELGRKKKLYALMGVNYYVVWDPDKRLRNGRLLVFSLRDGKYVRMKKPVFPSLRLSLTVWQGKYTGCPADWLRWCDAEGKLIPCGEEQTRRAKEAEKRALTAEERAKSAEERAERLAAQLRSLGAQPKNGPHKANGK